MFGAALWLHSTMVYRVNRGTHRMPVLVAFALIALVI